MYKSQAAMNAWKLAKPPNYNINVDLEYPYSECPFLREYNVIKIPKTGLIQHVDYWGRGRVESSEGVTGFKDCYNINYEYEVVNYDDVDSVNFKIPNRIPVASYGGCRTDNYIKDNSVKIVTLMNAPIYVNYAGDIARMINQEEGIVVVYGINRSKQDIKNLDEELNKKNFVCCPDFELPERLQGITMFPNHVAFLNLTEYKNALYRSIVRARYDKAVAMCLELCEAQQTSVISEVFQRLFKEVHPNTMKLAYKLFINQGYDMASIFLREFKNLLISGNMDIINQHYKTALRLYVTNRDNILNVNSTILWRFIPQTDDEEYFLDVKVEPEGLKCWETLFDPEDFKYPYGDDRSKWALGPLRYNEDLIFFVVNYGFQKGIKLAVIKNFYTDRLLWERKDDFFDEPLYFGWLVKPISN